MEAGTKSNFKKKTNENIRLFSEISCYLCRKYGYNLTYSITYIYTNLTESDRIYIVSLQDV